MCRTNILPENFTKHSKVSSSGVCLINSICSAIFQILKMKVWNRKHLPQQHLPHRYLHHTLLCHLLHQPFTHPCRCQQLPVCLPETSSPALKQCEWTEAWWHFTWTYLFIIVSLVLCLDFKPASQSLRDIFSIEKKSDVLLHCKKPAPVKMVKESNRFFPFSQPICLWYFSYHALSAFVSLWCFLLWIKVAPPEILSHSQREQFRKSCT